VVVNRAAIPNPGERAKPMIGTPRKLW
jgi:hypothetical protein